MSENGWTIWGVAELAGWLLHRPHYWPTGHDTEDCIDAHVECGITHIAWDLGRSVLMYHSDLPDATCYGLDAHYDEWYPSAARQARAEMDLYKERCQLRVALTHGSRTGCTIFGRLCMNRHYGPESRHGSDFARKHPKWYEIDREGWVDPTRLCYAIPEYRAERVAILKEAAEIGCEGLMLDFCRQPPMVRYHPALVQPYRDAQGVDPREIAPTNREAFLDWCAFRAEFVTRMLRELKEALDPLRERSSKTVPIHARVPNDGFEANLIAGFDLRTWCDEGLINAIHLSELRWLPGYTEWDDAPYVALGHEHELPVFASSNCLPAQRGGWGNRVKPRGTNPLVLAYRTLRSMDAGADGICLYQSDTGVFKPDVREALPKLGSRAALERYVSDEVVIAANPVTPENGEYGIDNHSDAIENLKGATASEGYGI